MKKAIALLLLLSQVCHAGRTPYIQTVQDLTVNGTLTLNGGSAGSGFPSFTGDLAGNSLTDSIRAYIGASKPIQGTGFLNSNGTAGVTFATSETNLRVGAGGLNTSATGNWRITPRGNFDCAVSGADDVLGTYYLAEFAIPKTYLTGMGISSSNLYTEIELRNTSANGFAETLAANDSGEAVAFGIGGSNSGTAIGFPVYDNAPYINANSISLIDWASALVAKFAAAGSVLNSPLQVTGPVTASNFVASSTGYGWPSDADTYIGHPTADTVTVTVAGLPALSLSPDAYPGTGATRLRFLAAGDPTLDIYTRSGAANLSAGGYLNLYSVWYGQTTIGTDPYTGGTAGLYAAYTLSGAYHPFTIGNADNESYGRITVLKGSSVDSSTPVNLSQNGAGTGKLTIPDSNSAHRYRVEVTMLATAGTNVGKAAAFTYEFLAKNVGGTVTQVGNTDMKTIAIDSGLTWTCGVGDISGTTVNTTTAADANSTVTSRELITEVGTQ